MQDDQSKLAILRQEVEKVVGRQLKEARDFELLSNLLLSHIHERLSPTTVKRLWGYLHHEEVQTRSHTLNVLSRFVGFSDYENFCAHAEELNCVQSGILSKVKISTEKMKCGQFLVITWRPDRRIVVRHLGESHFEIVEAENTKLNVGDTFSCHLMIQHEPLYLDDLVHLGQPSKLYVAGLRDGVFVSLCD